MACLVFLLLLLAMAGHSSAAIPTTPTTCTGTGTWCVCKASLDDATLQSALDYACGNGADCNSTHLNGPCYNPNTVKDHCSYAVNSYFQKKNQILDSCYFNGAATTTCKDPSVSGGCTYLSSSGATVTPPTTGTGIRTPSMGTPSTMLPNSPPMTNTGILGSPGNVNNPFLGPSGISTDTSDGGVRLPTSILLCSSIILTFFTTCLLVRA